MESSIPKKTIFLDRDGVINKDIGYLHRINEFQFIDGIFETCKHFLKINYQIIIVSNQSGIGRGYYSLEEYNQLTEWMHNQFNKQGIVILDSLYCPHHPISNCNCRKPKPGMLLESKIKHNVCIGRSWMIGDKETDIMAAMNAGIKNTILLRSHHHSKNKESNATYVIKSVIDSIKIISD